MMEIFQYSTAANDSHEDATLIVNEVLTLDTSYFQMDSSCMKSYGIRSGDILVLDKSLKVVQGSIVIAFTGGCFYCRYYDLSSGQASLLGDDTCIQANSAQPVAILGVVTSVCRNTLPASINSRNYRRICIL